MNPMFVLILIIGAIIIWFLLSFAFPIVGKFLFNMWNDAKDNIEKEDKEVIKDER